MSAAFGVHFGCTSACLAVNKVMYIFYVLANESNMFISSLKIPE